ncbi:MAG: cadherin-like beta sandwich domain-containing protein, partial [Sphingobacteriales bacterium]
ITATGASDANYEITYVDGSLSVTQAGLTITADNKTKAYGAPVPTLTASYSGFVNGETAADIDIPPMLSTTATAGSSVAGSPYTITATGASDANYAISYIDGTLTVTGSSNAVLASLELDPNIYKTGVAGSNYRDYTASVSNTTSSLRLTATAQDPTAIIRINDVVVASGIPSEAIQLAEGVATTINTVVTSSDGTTTKTYSIVITRKAASNAVLASLELDPNIYKTAATGTNYKDYTASVSNTTSSIKLTATTQDPNATVKINDVAVVSGVASEPVRLRSGANTINAVVTAADGVTIKTYSIIVTRKAGTNALLDVLVLDPNIYKTTVAGTNYRDYTASVSNATSAVTVTATTQDAEATLKINGDVIVSGTPVAIPLVAGVATTINTEVTAADGTTIKTYSIVITRRPANNALLTSLVLDPNIYKKGVAGANFKDYTASVSNTTSSVKITAITEDPNATVKINDDVVVSGTPVSIALGVGITTINTEVTAADGVTIKTYSIVITRKMGTNALLSSLVLDPNIYKKGVTGANYRDYTASVSNATSAIMVTATTQDPEATVKINDVDVVSGVPLSVSLDMAINIIKTVVTASDGTTIKTYSIVITRAGVNSARPSENLAIVTPVDNQEIATTEVTVSKAVS